MESCSSGIPTAGVCCSLNFGGIVLLICGMPPAMEVSGTPAFRGGAGCDSRRREPRVVAVCCRLFNEGHECCEDGICRQQVCDAGTTNVVKYL